VATTTVSSVSTVGVLSVGSTTGFSLSESVQFAGTAFGGLLTGTTYYIINIGAGTITLSSTRGGSALSIAGGSGTLLTLSSYFSVKSVSTSGVISVSSVNTFAIGNSVRLTGTAFGGLSNSVTYWIIAVDSGNNLITLSASIYGSVIAIAGGTGVMSLIHYQLIGPGAGNIIEYTDYNAIQSLVAPILGQYSTGYGQALATVTTNGGTGTVTYGPNKKVSAASWNALLADITALNFHQLNTSPKFNGSALTTVTTTTLIRDIDRYQYLQVATGLTSTTPITIGGVAYPGCYVIVPTGQNTTPTYGIFPKQSIRLNGWGGSKVTNSEIVSLGYISGTRMSLTGTNYTSSSPGALAGMKVTGAGILPNTFISSVDEATFQGSISGSTLTLSATIAGTVTIGMFIVCDKIGYPGAFIIGGAGTTWSLSLTQDVPIAQTGGAYNVFFGTKFSITQSQTVGSVNFKVSITSSFNVLVSDISTVNHALTVTFPSANAALYYFNSGSIITFAGSRDSSIAPGGSSTLKNTAWTTMLTNQKTISFSKSEVATNGASGTGSIFGWDWLYAHPSTDYTIFTNSLGSAGSQLYSPNQYDIVARLDATKTIITFKAEFKDLSTPANELTFKGGSNIFDTDEDVDGTLISTVNLTYASGSYVSATAYLPAPANTIELSAGTTVAITSIQVSNLALGAGGFATFTITTTGIANGTSMTWLQVGTATSGYFQDGLVTGAFNINSDVGIITRAVAISGITALKTLQLELFLNGVPYGATPIVTIS
jgi:hypothetical protein